METAIIFNYKQLTNRIEVLKSDFDIQNSKCIESYKFLSNALDPVSILKYGINTFSKDENLKFNIIKLTLNAGANFILDQIVGRNKSIKGFISSIIIEKISEILINKNTGKIISYFKNLVYTKKEQNSNHI